MSFSFIIPEMNIGGSDVPSPIQFYKRGFNLGGSASIDWREVTLSGVGALTLTNALANSLLSLKLFGGTEQRNIPTEYTQVNYVTNTAKTWLDTGVQFDFSKNYEIEIRVRGTSGSWYILQAREGASASTYGISGSSTGDTIILGFNGININTSQVNRITGNIYYIKGTINNGKLTLYVKDETAGTEETVTGTYTPSTGTSVNIGLFGNGQSGAGGLQGVAPNTDVHYARIKENDTYIIDYVPCNQNTTVGFYDKASGTLKTTTDLSAGADAVPTPDTPMDIVSNNGVLKYGRIGKNLVNPDAVTQNAYINNSGGTTSDNGYVISDYIPVQGGQKITISTVSSSTYPFGGVACKAFYDANKNYINNSATPNSGINASNPATLVVPANAAYFRTSIGSAAAGYVQVEYGDTATTFEPYKAGIYTDGTTETVTVHGKNYFDRSQTPQQIYVTDALALRYGYSIPVKAGTYTISGATNNNIYCKDYVGGVYGNALNFYTTSQTYTLSQNGYILIYSGVASNFDDQTSIQVEQGSTATTYETYYNGGSATAEMLLKIGDYKDVQSVLDGAVTRNVGVKVLDGTENWNKGTNTPQQFFTILPNQQTSSTGYSTHFIDAESSLQMGTGKFLIGNSVAYFIRDNNDVTLTINDWKQWLKDQYNAGFPVIIVYPLATATTESVTAQPLSIQAGTNIVEITQASMDNLGLEVSYKATV